MSSIYDWSKTAADNQNSDADINWIEGQLPGTVNGSAREMMARLAEFVGDIGGALTAGGTANALTVTANSAFTAYANGLVLALRIATDNTAASTLNVNGLGAKSIRKYIAGGDSPLTGAELQAAGIYLLHYSTALNAGAGGWLLLNPTIDLATQIKTSVDLAVPVGMVVDYAGTAAPTNWLLCYGQAVSRTTYADLFTAIGTVYGVGDGSTTFNLPDARGRVVAGQDDMGGTSANRLTGQSGGVNGDTLGGVGGDETHELTIAQLAAHTHTVTGTTNSTGSHTHNIATRERGGGNNIAGTVSIGGDPDTADTATTSDGAHSHTVSGTAASTGSGTAHNNVQPTLILNKIIKALAA